MDKEIFKRCAEFRKQLGYTQKQVADELCYSVMNISKFENGKSRNLEILLWYLEKGMDLDDYIK